MSSFKVKVSVSAFKPPYQSNPSNSSSPLHVIKTSLIQVTIRFFLNAGQEDRNLPLLLKNKLYHYQKSMQQKGPLK